MKRQRHHLALFLGAVLLVAANAEAQDLKTEFLGTQQGFSHIAKTTANGVTTIRISGQVGMADGADAPAATLAEQAEIAFSNVVKRVKQGRSERRGHRQDDRLHQGHRSGEGPDRRPGSGQGAATRPTAGRDLGWGDGAGVPVAAGRSGGDGGGGCGVGSIVPACGRRVSRPPAAAAGQKTRAPGATALPRLHSLLTASRPSCGRPARRPAHRHSAV